MAGLMLSMPALFTRTSTRPHVSIVFATMRSTSSFLDVSTFMAMALRPRPVISPATFSTCGSVRLTATMSAPCWARPSAIVLPRPRPAPVTMTTLPVRSKILLMVVSFQDSRRHRGGRHAGARAAAELANVDGHYDQPEADCDLAQGRQPGRVDHRDHVLREPRALQDDDEDGGTPHGAAHRARAADDHRHPGVEGDLRRELVGHDVGDIVRPQAARDGREA